MKVTVVITTKNRKDELIHAIQSSLAQTVAVEVLVLDDGSTDGTAEVVRAAFPQATVHRFEVSKGYIVRRNDGARLARGDVIFSIDDDAAFSTPCVIEQTLAEFDHPQIGAVAVPYINVRKDSVVRQRAPKREDTYLADSYIGTAHAVRRDIFLKLGGYREHLVHQGEESDYCIRMLDAGHFVRLGNADPIHHFESPKRDYGRVDYYGARNAILFVWQNVPWPVFPLHLLATTFNVLRWTLEPRRFLLRLRAVGAGYGWCAVNLGARRPVSQTTNRLFRRLKMPCSLPIDEMAE